MRVDVVMALLLTGANAVWDIKKRDILLFPTIAAGAGGAVYAFASGRSVLWLAAALLPGLLMLALCILSKGQAGCGDAILILALGVWVGFSKGFAVLVLALGLAAVSGIILLIKKHKNREIPFVPFLLAGSILQLVVL